MFNRKMTKKQNMKVFNRYQNEKKQNNKYVIGFKMNKISKQNNKNRILKIKKNKYVEKS